MNREQSNQKNSSSFSRFQSIQTRLPFLIFLLLISMIIAFGWLSYVGIKKSTFESGNLRLKSLSTQLSNMFSQSAQGLVTLTKLEANKAAVKTYLRSGGKDSANETVNILKKLHSDSTWIAAQLLNQKKEIVLQFDNERAGYDAGFSSALLAQSKIDTGKVGKIISKNDSLYYTVSAAITNGKEVIGYLVRLRRMQTTAEAVKRFSDLIGTGVTMYIGNADGSIWTDLNKPVTFLPEVAHIHDSIITYAHKNGGHYYAAKAPVKNTEWGLVIELPEKNMVEQADSFLRIAITTGIIILIAGIVLAWIISRNLTKPLYKLTAAVKSMAEGNHFEKVTISRQDELGVLAESFNKMSEQVYQSQKNLEEKVKERTKQLEASNNELEAFSYSVSHDLRAPLRAISGYAGILKEDYGQNFDEEGTRIIDTVITNAKKMGLLIDDLISFARLGRKENVVQYVDMKNMAQSCFKELEGQFPGSTFTLVIDELPFCYTDESLIKQVWLNLIGNAMKYSSGKPQPVIEIRGKKEPGKIIYSISDNGVGFEMKYAHKLFGVFQRLHGHEEFEGTGIGLALVKRILDKQAGEVWAEAEKNKGAVFYFSLPDQEQEILKSK